MSPFHWRQFCRCMINRPSHAFPWTQNVFTNCSLILTIYSSCSFMDAMFSTGNFGETFSCFMSFTHAHSTSVGKSAYLCFSRTHTMSKSGFGKFQHKNFGYSLEKLGSPSLLLFHEWENPELLRGYLYFWNALLILKIFRIWYSRNGRHVCITQSLTFVTFIVSE